MERTEPRRGSSGALEKPYRSTGLSWTLDLGTETTDATSAMLEAFRAEVIEAGVEPVEGSSRFMFHLDEQSKEDLMTRLQAVLDEFVASDESRKARGDPPMGGILMLHRLGRPD